MSKYVPDISSRRWVIISSQRTNRPEVNGHSKTKRDPFAEGHEKDATDEVFRIGKGEKNKPGWDVRVILNKYPITDQHEVVIHSPDSKKDIASLTDKEIEAVFTAYRARFNYYRDKGQVLIFCNTGEFAGASIEHPHSQIVVIPPQINLDLLAREPINNIVTEKKHLTIYCPDFSQWPYELWIAPKREKVFFGDITDEELKELAITTRNMIKELHRIYKQHQLPNEFGFNYYISPKEGWYLRIIPRFFHRAGFELGTGLSVNVVDPSDAMLAYRGVEERMTKVMDSLKKKF